ncbi:Ppx/GppA family phosphatase [Erythrobacter insulae]|uniref:Ppx/GppA family phosphatase n=1 Tax=Erythrobacter insulae TaxID=2584124 RepID=A0A547PCB0_9SPHN|nr:Ppx/GppA phosphatase family protein [Erythrobacter insulae]TRD11773.1 Ppx/GppA family phosphatase [Erythrobacter insulae]
MAAAHPPDADKKAGKKRGRRSGKVADFRYKRPFRHDGKSDCAKGQTRAHCQSENQGSPLNQTPNGKPQAAHNGHRPGEAYAALDLGTNNCRLLIARPSGKDFTVIDAFSRVVKLGENLATTGKLSDEAMDRALGALSVCADKLRRRKVRLARSVATEACRRAANGPAFIERVRNETGIALDIITAEEEARLAVLGCHILLEQGEGPAMIFDIGGGSTELVLLKPGGKIPRIIDWQSVPWGVVSLTDTVGRGENNRDARMARYAKMREIVSGSFAPFADRIADAATQDDIRLLGTSGTVTTLASLHLELPHYDRKAVDGLIVPSDAMRDISGSLSAMSPEDRCTLPCIGNDRADLVVAGCAILESILDLWPAERLGVADRGIREGILRSLMAAERQSERALKALHDNRIGKAE